MLKQHNQYVQLYRTARQRLQSADAPNLAIQFFGHEGVAHGDRYSGPTTPEVAALIVGEFTPQCHKFDAIVEATSGQLEHISYLNPSLMPLLDNWTPRASILPHRHNACTKIHAHQANQEHGRHRRLKSLLSSEMTSQKTNLTFRSCCSYLLLY